jgi:hypothetical protein
LIDTCSPCKVTPASKYQDKKYGQNKRVFTISLPKQKARCTVCGAEKNVGSATLEKEKKKNK